MPCTASALGLSTEPTEGAAGSIYTPVDLVNTSAAACTVSTHLVLSFLDINGQPVGPSITSPESAGPGVVTLAPTGSAKAFVRYSQPGAMNCQPLDTPTSAQLIFNQTEAISLPPMVWPLCTDRIVEQVTLGDIIATSPFT